MEEVLKTRRKYMRKVFVTALILAALGSCKSVPEKPADDVNDESAVFSNKGVVSFQNEEYLFIGALVEDLEKTLKIWDVPDSQGFPKIATTTKIKRFSPISLFLTYSVKKADFDMTYDFKLLRPDGTFSKNAYTGLKIASGASPDTLIHKASKLLAILFDETDSSGAYQFHVSIFDKDDLITHLVLEFNLIE
jgi:hypothetical protein